MEIRSLHDQGASAADIAGRLGLTIQQVAAVKAWWTIRANSAAPEGGASEDETIEAFESKFGLERDLQASLRANIQQLG